MRLAIRLLLLSSLVVCSALVGFDVYLGTAAAVGLLFIAVYVLGRKFMSGTAKGALVAAVMLFSFRLYDPVWDGAETLFIRQPGVPFVRTIPLRSIMLALEEYHKKNGSFPPAYVVDANGNPMHSWRAILLPYIDDPSPKYDLSEPWNSAKNSQLVSSWTLFSCPSNPQPPKFTSYLAVVGPNTAWPGKKPLKLSDVPDGGRRTIIAYRNCKVRHRVDGTARPHR